MSRKADGTALASAPAQTIATAPSKRPAPLVIPDNGKVFELTLDGDAANPNEMEKKYGCRSRNLKFKGHRIRGLLTCRFILMSVGYQPNVEAANLALTAHGVPSPGQWREAFMIKYPRPSGNEPIGFTGDEWASPTGELYFPFAVRNNRWWRPDFRGCFNSLPPFWRFAVAIV